jgi:hypothetical protein
MKSAVKRAIDVRKGSHLYRNRTVACLILSRCHAVGEPAQCEPPEKLLVQSEKGRHDSIFPFCKSSRCRIGFAQFVL